MLIDGQVKTYRHRRGTVRRSGVTGVNRDRAGNLWIRTKGAGVVKMAGGRTERYTTREGLPADDPLGFFFADRHGQVWLSSPDRRIYRISNGTRELVGESGLMTLFEDREGSVWLGTCSGLFRVRDFSVKLHTQLDGLSTNWIYSILQSRSGAMWIGSWGGGLNRYEHGRFSTYTAAQGLGSNLITSIHEDRSGRLWVGTTVGICYLANDRFEPYDERGASGRSGLGDSRGSRRPPLVRHRNRARPIRRRPVHSLDDPRRPVARSDLVPVRGSLRRALDRCVPRA